MNMIQSNFREWTLDKIDEVFGLKQVFQSDLLDTWLRLNALKVNIRFGNLKIIQ